MKAAVTDGKGKVWVADVPRPEPGAYQCLCRIHACATCTGTDMKHIHDKLPWAQQYPGILGHESIGTVVQRGAKVRYVSEGDVFLRPTAVYHQTTLGGFNSLWGGFAEYGLVTDVKALLEDQPEAEPHFYCKFQLPLPADSGLSMAAATMLITLKECASYVANAGVTMWTSVAVLGTGAVGHSMCRFARLFGATPLVVVGRRAEPLAAAAALGADVTVNCRDTDPVAAIKAATDGRGVDLIIDTTGAGDFVRDLVPALAPGGKVALYATYERGGTVRDDVPPERVAASSTNEPGAHAYLLGAVRHGLVDCDAFYSHLLPLDEIAEGFAMIERKQASKIVFTME